MEAQASTERETLTGTQVPVEGRPVSDGFKDGKAKEENEEKNEAI